MTDRAMLTAIAVVADALLAGQLARGWVDVPGLILAVAATFAASLAWFCKEKRR